MSYESAKQKKDELIKNEGVAADAPNLLGAAKGAEAMFHNAIYVDLDIIQLAATQANIMISLNGRTIFGAFTFNSSVAFPFPAGVFMLTAAASIIFVLLAASPSRAISPVGIGRGRWHVVARLSYTRDAERGAEPANL